MDYTKLAQSRQDEIDKARLAEKHVRQYHKQGIAEAEKAFSVSKPKIQKTIAETMSHLQNHPEALFSISVGEVDQDLLHDVTFYVRDFVVGASPKLVAHTDEATAFVNFAGGVFSGLRPLVKTEMMNIATSMLKNVTKSEKTKTDIVVPHMAFATFEQALLDTIGIEYEALADKQKDSLKSLYDAAFRYGVNSVPEKLFEDVGSLAYQTLSERVSNHPSVATKDTNFLTKLSGENMEAINSVMAEGEEFSESLALELYTLLFTDGLLGFTYNGGLDFITPETEDFIKSAGYADGIESVIKAKAPPAIASVAREILRSLKHG